MEETSKKVRHTPGPWEIDDTRDGVLYTHPTGFKFHICIMGSGGSTTMEDEEELANLHLISSAPSLLEAMEDLYMSVYAGNSVSIEDAMNRAPKTDAFEQKIINAIKLAKGEIKTELI